MELMAVLSKTEQVANFLREGIGSDKLRPGDKIQSSRNLAANFLTSKQVVESAFNILEDEGLIIRKARQGAFVNKASALSHLKEVYILGIGVAENDSFFNEIVKMTCPPILKDDFTFIARTYSYKASTESVLDVEVNRINNMPGIDCVLINAAPLNRMDVKKCLRINRPVMFFGDFSQGDIPDLEFNQITVDNAYLAEQHVDYIRGEGHSEITLFSGSLKHLFNRQYYEGVLRKAKEKNVKINVVEFPRWMSRMAGQEHDETIGNILKQALLDKLIFPAGIISGLESISIKKGLESLDPALYRKIFFMPETLLDYNPLYNAIIKRIEEVMILPDKYEKIWLKINVEVIGG